MTIEVNFSSYQGEDLSLPVTIYDEDDVTPLNITGQSIEFVAHSMYSTAPLVTESTALGTITFVNALLGQINVSVPNTDIVAAGMTPADYMFYIKRTDVGGQAVYTIGIWSFLSV